MSKPNIILINCDDLGYGDLGCYGSTVNDTPALDKMAAEGMRFTDFYMASPVCSPSRGAMMTGCYPPRISFGRFPKYGSLDWDTHVLFPGQPSGLNPEEKSIARLLKDQGYATKLVGKWHCGDQPEFLPTSHGFDEYFGLPYSNDMGRQNEEGWDWPPLPLLRDKEVIQEQPDQTSLTERYVAECVRFMRDKKDQPFFLYLAHLHVHLPHYAPECFLQKSRNGRYGGAVACIDWAAEVLLHELKQLGLDENTLVVFTSDNGSRCKGEGGSNDPLRDTKSTTWEGGQRVPCIARWPGRIAAGSTCTELSSAMDLLPTFCELGGASVPEDRIIDGRNIGPLLFEEGAKTPHEFFFYYKGNELEAVRDLRWKLHFSKGGEAMEELYDLQEDIGESKNVYAEQPEVVARLSEAARLCAEDIGDERSGVSGANVRPIGVCDNPDTLTHYDENHPYMISIYDLKERG